MLSTDKNILVSGSESQRRMIDYGGLVDELHIVIKSPHFATPPHKASEVHSKASRGRQISNLKGLEMFLFIRLTLG